MPTERMGPAARSFAADAHDCIMVRIQTDLPHTSVRHEDAPQWRAPLDHTQIGNVRRPSSAGKAPYEILWGGRREDGNFLAACNRWSAAMPQPNDLSRSLVALDQNSTIIAVIEMSQSSWLVAGVLPGIERQPRKKLEPSPEQLLAVL